MPNKLRETLKISHLDHSQNIAPLLDKTSCLSKDNKGKKFNSTLKVTKMKNSLFVQID